MYQRTCVICAVEFLTVGRGQKKYCGRCHIEECSEAAKLGSPYCVKHGKRIRRYGDPSVTGRVFRLDDNCSVDGCPNAPRAKGLCGLHYQRQRNGLPLTNERIRARRNARAICSVKKCDRLVSAKGFCPMHYQRWRTHGDPLLRTRKLPERAIGDGGLTRGWTRSQKDRFYKYGITPEEFDRLFASQDGRCLGCRTETPGGKGWVVDHCHTSGATRRILCNNCNTILGLAYEDEATLLRLAAIAKADRQLKLV